VLCLAAELLVRALRSDRRTVLKDWTKRNNPITRVGRRTLLQSSLVVRTYFPHAFPVSSEHLAASTGVTEEIQR
jgi:hypothetical protein